MALQAGLQVPAAILMLALDRVVSDCSAAAQTLFDDIPSIPELLSKDARPSLVRAKAVKWTAAGNLSICV